MPPESRAARQPFADERTAAELIAELERAITARDELLSIVGHELRNPLSAVFMQVLSMRERIDAGETLEAEWIKRRVDAMETRLQDFLSLLERILDVSRLGSGRIDLVYEDVDLNRCVHEVARRFDREANAARCQLRVTARGKIVGRWDRMRVEQIVSNLVSNAVRYGAGKPVDVETEASPAEARLIVRDRGIGISPEDQGRIFQRFERAERLSLAGSASGFGS